MLSGVPGQGSHLGPKVFSGQHTVKNKNNTNIHFVVYCTHLQCIFKQKNHISINYFDLKASLV